MRKLALAALLLASSAHADTLLYNQENVPVIYQNIQWDGYWGQNVGPVDVGHCGPPTWFPSAGPSNYPFPNFVPDSLFNPMTWYAGDGDSNTAGIQGGLSYQVNGLQGGNTYGISLAPRAVDATNTGVAVLVNYWFCDGQMATPWVFPHLGIKVQADMTLPFVYVPPVGGGTIFEQGTVFSYFTVQIGNTLDNTQYIYISPRILQNQYPNAADQQSDFCHEFCQGDQIWHDYSNNPILFPEIGNNSSWISSCGNGTFTIGPDPSWPPRNYCWTMSATQLTQAIQAINSAPQIPRHNYDTNPAHWKVRILNLDAEAWAFQNDTRLGLQISNFKLWQRN